MTLGPTILLPPLYEIQRNVQNIHEKYGGQMLLNALDLDSDHQNQVRVWGGAPRAVVFGFLSLLSEQLFRFNMLKATIKEEERLKKNIARTIIALTIIMIFTGAGLIIYYVIIERFYKYDNIMFTRIETLYFGLAVILLMIYLLFISIKTYHKYMTIYEQFYEVDSLFHNEASIQHMLSMMQPDQRGIFSQLQNREYAAKGINPLMGYFLHLNRNYDVTYTFHPDSVNNQSGGRGLNHKRTFKFTDSRNNPYSLNMESLLSNDFIPSPVIDKNNPKKKYVDPFVGDNLLIVHPEVFRRKIQKYDIYGQYGRLVDAITYFESVLSVDNVDSSGIDETLRQEFSERITEILILDDFIVMPELMPHPKVLERLSDEQKFDPINLTPFSEMVVNHKIPYAYYDYDKRKGYVFNREDMAHCAFLYIGTRDVKQPNLSFLRSFDDVMINVATGEPPDNLSDHFRRMETDNLPSVSYFEASVQSDTGEINPDFDTVFRPHRDSANQTVSLRNLFKKTGRTLGEPIIEFPEDIYIYRMPLTVFNLQNREMHLESTFQFVRPFLHNNVMTRIGDIDPDYKNVNVDGMLISKIMNTLDLRLKKDAVLLKNSMMDYLNELPMRIKEKGSKENIKNPNEIDNLSRRYIPYKAFLLHMRSMPEKEFLNQFIYHLDMLRHTSSSLKSLHEKYDYGHSIFNKNMMMIEFTFYLFTILGGLEMIRQCVLMIYRYKCANIRFLEDEDTARRDFRKEPDDTPTQITAKSRLLNKKLEKIRTRRNRTRSKQLLIMSVLIVAYLLTIAYIYGLKERYRTLYTYNKYILEANGNDIVVNSEQAFQYVVQHLQRGQFMHLSSQYEDTGDQDDTFHLLKKNTDPTDSPISLSDDVNLEMVHQQLIQAVEKFKKCNMLMDSKTTELPFPIFETIIYFLVMAIIIFIFVFTFIRLAPLKQMRNIQNWRKIKELMLRNVDIDPRSFGFDCDEPPKKKKGIYNTLTYVSAIVLFIIGVLFAITLFNNTNDFTSSLYSSSLFREMQCY